MPQHALVAQTEPVAAREQARNTLVRGGAGRPAAARVSDDRAHRLRPASGDEGQGTAGVERAPADGRTSGSGPGRGPRGARRTAHGFTVESAPRAGATAAAASWAAGPPRPREEA
ncbi:anti-sigma regulatory factor [Streptomyces tropicalis]|uniref:Anti-sigma regulatory factor n=1 Tax=Streptomyces tropicalis TaxID=3034234 RepID=A0ABT6A9B4_9ACTN|nr:anti-sigma regulatory factor [Streptomyces tropicalis]MDF3301247.1 anti-sigma regulatory factor [Streptomyces tropicalis]